MATGFLDDRGNPYLEIQAHGPVTEPVNLVCLVDTGFTGFLSVPLLRAFPIGAVLVGTTSVAFANGETEYRLVGLARVVFDDQSNVGTILIEPQGQEPMLGMDFLRKFNRRLIIDPVAGTVEFTPATGLPVLSPPTEPIPTAEP